MTSRNPIENLGQSLGEYLREQRTSARLSLRQLADLAGVSNPYLSQIERGVKKPSAEILQQLAKGLQISSESLYVKAGFLDEQTVSESRPWDVEASVAADSSLSERQKATLIDIYRSFVGDKPAGPTESAATAQAPAQAATKRAVAKQPATKKSATKKSAPKAATKKAAATRVPATKSTAAKTTAAKTTAAKAARGTKASPSPKTSNTTTSKE